MVQYFNTSFKQKTINGKVFLVCDPDSVTALLMPITLILKDKDGIERKKFMPRDPHPYHRRRQATEAGLRLELQDRAQCQPGRCHEMDTVIKSEQKEAEDVLMPDGQRERSGESTTSLNHRLRMNC